jgi:hypothetical protein
MRESLTKVFRRAGCGKSARPVRRGDGEPREFTPVLSVLLYRSSGAPGQAWLILWDERSPPCELSVRHVAIERSAEQSVMRSLEMRTCEPQRKRI